MRGSTGRDIALVAAAFALCPLAAALAPGDPSGPLARADAIARFEQGLGLFFEPAVARWVSVRPELAGVLGFLYLWGHVPATVGALVWARLERPRCFALARDAFLATQLVVIAGYLLVPTAPPRMRSGPLDAGGLVHTVQSPYAAMPSGHVAFAVVVAAIVGSQARSLRFVAPLYPLLVIGVVIATRNHFWLDAVAGMAAAATGFVLAVMARTAFRRPASRCPAVARSRGDHVGPSASPPRRNARSSARA